MLIDNKKRLNEREHLTPSINHILISSITAERLNELVARLMSTKILKEIDTWAHGTLHIDRRGHGIIILIINNLLDRYESWLNLLVSSTA